MPEPDWAEENWKGCEWYYANRIGADGESVKGVTVRFGQERVVNGLGDYKISFFKSSESSRK